GNGNQVGGGAAGDANVFIGDQTFGSTGVQVGEGSSTPDANVIQGNLFGVEPDGSVPADANTGIVLNGATNTVIGNDDGPGGLTDVQAHKELGNVMAGNGDNNSTGILIENNSSGTIAAGNFIGVDRSRQATTGEGDGIDVSGSSHNQLGPGNVIANSVNDGISLDQSSNFDRIVANSIYDNGGLGIDLATGANANIAAPTVGVFGSKAAGTVSGNSGDTVFVELFGNPDCSGSLNGAGRDFLTFAQVTIGPSGTARWSTPIGLGNDQGVTATATNQLSDTSQFSSCAVVEDAADNLVVNTANDSTNPDGCTAAECSLRDAINAANLAGGGTINFAIDGGGPFS
ncbi:MAG: CSLREA domain-containing protein, partial [Gaiellaceae bacterium]